jgi:hypothetical protein
MGSPVVMLLFESTPPTSSRIAVLRKRARAIVEVASLHLRKAVFVLASMWRIRRSGVTPLLSWNVGSFAPF